MIGFIITIVILILLFTMAIAGLSFAPWVPCWSKDLERIFKLADLKPGQIFYDLGCGSGKTVFYAAKNFQAKSIGLEISLPLYFFCQLKQVIYRDKNACFKFKNLFKADLTQADVVYFFGMPKKLKNKLKQKLEKELKPGAKVVSYAFPVEGWQPVIVDKPKSTDVDIYLYQR